ncbi:transcriptional regulator VisN [Rhizobium sp. SG2393]|uniref:transcriptional regulator VisN n=1 Tax=Rhizobium sp. SG2393 TaxID=3276279 RepID=UPI00366EEA23
MDAVQSDFSVWPVPGAIERVSKRARPLDRLVDRLADLSEDGGFTAGLAAVTEYVGARHYLLARIDGVPDGDMDFVVCADWPFYLVRRFAAIYGAANSRSSEFERCVSVLRPSFTGLPDDIDMPKGLSRQYCALTFSVGRIRYVLALLFPENVILSPESLREVTLLTGYFASFAQASKGRGDRDYELTEREIECLYWIAEGKTSDEIAVILGISRNTINNYITSVMRKTATKTRSEAIAHAVRHNLV